MRQATGLGAKLTLAVIGINVGFRSTCEAGL